MSASLYLPHFRQTLSLLTTLHFLNFKRITMTQKNSNYTFLACERIEGVHVQTHQHTLNLLQLCGANTTISNRIRLCIVPSKTFLSQDVFSQFSSISSRSNCRY